MGHRFNPTICFLLLVRRSSCYPKKPTGSPPAISSPTTGTPSTPNIGVYTTPEHKLWVADAVPSAEDAASGYGLKEGEVMVKIRSTGICG